MQQALADYFQGEKYAGLALFTLGCGCAIAALSFHLYSRQFRPLSWTLLAWALLEMAIGLGLFLKTDPQVGALVQQLASDSSAFLAAETPRMLGVQRNFIVIEGVWLVLFAGSALMALWRKGDLMVSGVAIGVLVNTAVLLSFDLLAETRGSAYLRALQARAAMPVPSSADDP